MKKKAISHFIITRFNCELSIANGYSCLDSEWLEHRLDVFEKICFPSVRAQTSKNFKWLILLNAKSPSWLKEKFQLLQKAFPQMETVYIEGVLRRRTIQDLIGESLVPDAQCLVTTRLDSDDALAFHFVKETQKNLTHFDLPYVINFSSGLVKYRNNLYEVEERSSSFLSLCEAPSKKVLTVFAKKHNQWAPEYKVLQIKSMHSWLRCIHSKNLHNTKQGTKISQSIRIPSFTFGIRDIELIDSKSGRFSMALKLNYRVLRNHIQRYAKILRV